MRYFICLCRLGAGSLGEVDRQRCDAIVGVGDAHHQWHDHGSIAVLLHHDGIGTEPTIARCGDWVGAGIVRLDNRDHVACGAPGLPEAATDLDLVLSALHRRGIRAVPELLGDFAFVARNVRTGDVVAARDAFGVRCLYYRERGDILAFASRAGVIADEGEYDAQYLTELVATCEIAPERTSYARVQAVPAGAMLLASEQGRVRVTRYWAAEDYEPASATSALGSECEEFRALFAEAVRSRLSDGCRAWAVLSGGLDSSSVVSMAHRLASESRIRSGVEGAVSWVYRWSPDSDERDYAEHVVRRTRARWEVLQDTWFWRDDGVEPPHTDMPDPAYAMYARDRRTTGIVRGGEGTVLLTGFGADQYLLGNMFFFADWLATGRIREALREMARRAALGRVSFWRLAYENAVVPLLPASLRGRATAGVRLPGWIPAERARKWELTSRLGGALEYDGRVRHKYADLVMTCMRSIPRVLRMYSVLDDGIDVRHPFLHRPLVEFSLRLPPDLCVRPNERKWILREAMRGILPEEVRARVGKGSNGGCIGQSLLHERARIDALLRAPLLADLGCIEPDVLRKAVEMTRRSGNVEDCATVSWTLAVELWLQVRSGRWLAEAGKLFESMLPARAALTIS